MAEEEGQKAKAPLLLEEIPVRELLREQLFLQKFLKHLQSSNLPTLHDANALKITKIQNSLLQQNISAFREGRYEQYLLNKIGAINGEVEYKVKMLKMNNQSH